MTNTKIIPKRTDKKMKKFNLGGYEVVIFEGYDGDEVFITKGENKVYSTRTNKGQGFQRAMEVIKRQN
jgi:hypothetical protein